MTRLQWIAALVGMLLVPGCTDRAPRPSGIDSMPPAVDDTNGVDLPLEYGPSYSVATKPRPVTAPVVTSTKIDTLARWIDTVRVKDTLQLSFYVRVRTVIERRDSVRKRYNPLPVDTVVPIPVPDTTNPPIVLAGTAWGPYAWPVNDFCTDGGYTGTVLNPIYEGALKSLAQAKRCGIKVAFTVPRRFLQRYLNGGGFQVVSSFVNDTLPKKGTPAGDSLDAYVKDGTLQWIWTGDDIGDGSRPEWNGGGTIPFSLQLARWDSIGLAVKQRWPTINTVLRGLPSQMASRKTWSWTEAAAVQYLGTYGRHGPPTRFFAREDSIGKSLGLGIILGINELEGGCGPDPARCYEGVIGSDRPGELPGKWMPSANELYYYHKVLLAVPGMCGAMGWRWDTSQHERPDIQDAVKRIAPLAKARVPAPCKR